MNNEYPYDLIGFKNKNKQNSEYEVINFAGFREISNRKFPYYTIKFDTGYIRDSRRDVVISGSIKNPDIHTNLSSRINENEFVGYSSVNTVGEPFKVISFDKRTKNKMYYKVKFLNTNNIKSFDKYSIKEGRIKDPIHIDGFIGYSGTNTQGEKFEVVSFANKGTGQTTFNVKFNDTGYIKEFYKDCILKGTIKDPYYPSIYGVACCGEAKTRNENGMSKEYYMWHSMISRCYNPNSQGYKTYGGVGITVCDRWLVFENFLEDIKTLDGYNLWKLRPDLYSLDKDTLQQGIENYNKIYSPETCMFISNLSNTIEMHNRKSTGLLGVFIQPSGNYKVKVADDYYGTFSDINAAANMYNHVTQYRNYPQEFMNNVPYMSRLECNEYRTQPNSGKKVMCRVLEKQKNKNSTTNTYYQLIQMCHIVDNTQPRN